MRWMEGTGSRVAGSRGTRIRIVTVTVTVMAAVGVV